MAKISKIWIYNNTLGPLKFDKTPVFYKRGNWKLNSTKTKWVWKSFQNIDWFFKIHQTHANGGTDILEEELKNGLFFPKRILNLMLE